MHLEELKLTPRRRAILDSLDIKSVEDLLMYYPYRYEENVVKDFKEWNVGDNVIFEGELLTYPSTFRYGRRSTTRFKVRYEDVELLVTIFNRPWVKGLNMGEKLVVKGRYDGGFKLTALNYSLKPITEELGIKAIYPLKDGIKQSDIVKMIAMALEKMPLEDDVPKHLISKHQLIDLPQALQQIHMPSSKQFLKKAISRLKYEEFLRFYTALSVVKNQNSNFKQAKVFKKEKVDELINSLPYKLTEDQIQSIDEILGDLSQNHTVTRLLQGDVGSGKTIVGAIALYACYLSGYQGALMAPTEILAKQHYQSLKEILKDLRIALLYSDMKDGAKIKQAISEGEYDIVVGTHALFSDDVQYHNLGLVIADEQHRFGVRQRRKLKAKGQNVDVVLMSATPIPRTLASSIYGDMEVSTIETMPSGRKGCDTILIRKNSIVDIMSELKAILKEGRQAYIIASAIDQSEFLHVKDANNLYQSLIEVMKPYRLAILHGKMDQELKDATMRAFVEHQIDVLISTTVVEVGVNVKNATMMIIYDADRFGLSQLHQLRGRVQRSNYRGTCYLLTGSKDENALKRLNVLVASNDGFYIANEDLKFRGPGDILGTRQSGLPPFVLGDIINDADYVKAAKKDVEELLANLDNAANQKYYAKISALAISNDID